MKKEYDGTMKVLDSYSIAANEENPLVERLQNALYFYGTRYSYTHSRRWRAITQISLAPNTKGGKVETAFYADIQSINGGGSWAQAKHKALYSGADFTRQMTVKEIKQIIANDPEFADTEMANSIYDVMSFDQLTEEQLHWLVDVERGPGIAPGYGGIKIPIKIQYRDETSKLCKRRGWIMCSFSGAKQWQDLYFALCLFNMIFDAIERYDNSIRVSFEIAGLTRDPEIALWTDLMKLG